MCPAVVSLWPTVSTRCLGFDGLQEMPQWAQVTRSPAGQTVPTVDGIDIQAATPPSLLLMPAFDHTVDFANWWSRTFPGTQCPVLPKKPGDLSLSARMALEQDNPILF